MSVDATATSVAFTVDGREIGALAGESILQACRRHGIDIPHLCFKEGLRPDGNCRVCVVEIEGERLLAPSCCRAPVAEMVVRSDSERARRAQRMVLELLLANAPEQSCTLDNELLRWCRVLGLEVSRFAARQPVLPGHSHPAIAVNLQACIQCMRCVRACREIQVNDVIGTAYRGAKTQIAFDLDDDLGDSSCVACGECVQACPTGALAPAGGVALKVADRRVDTVCPYCGVGCHLTYNMQGNRILTVEGRNGPTNQGRLCVKGRYGFDYIHHPQRLTRPLIRRVGVAKTIDPDLDPVDPSAVFREASWEEALDVAADGLKRILEQNGPRGLAGFGSAKGSNEEAYLFQKLVRVGFGSNNVDHCTRLCHASSVAALLQMIGSGAVSNPMADVAKAEVIFVIGSNTAENHPVTATFIKNERRAGKTLIVADPRETPLSRHADHFLNFRPDTDVALLNAIMHAVIEQGLVDEAFIARRTKGFAAFKAHLEPFTPEKMAPICGIDAGVIREVARLYAGSKGSIIFWGMGISQHIHGTDNARALISLALMTGQIGRPGCGLHPLRGQNNVQGASDVGLIPMVFPDYRRVDDAAARAAFEELWQSALDPRPGLTVVEVMHAILDGQVKGMYIMGENPAMSDPNLNHARKALSSLEHLVVQDIFLTETACYADVVLPASAHAEKTGTFTNSDRRVQLGRQAVEPPGEARQDLWIIQGIAARLGLEWQYEGPQAVFTEMRQAMASIRGITWERLEREGSVTYPCLREGDPGEPVLFTETFPTPDGLATFVPSPFIQADELPDLDYPFVLITGRQLEHWHTGAMTRRSKVLDALEPLPTASLHWEDLARLGLVPGEPISIISRRGELRAYARTGDGVQQGQVFLPFCYREAAANLLTNEALDPDAKIPEFKFCAVKVSRVS
jgi:formate dehydrogenase major subunit